MRPVQRAGRRMHDPSTREEWQEAVDGARFSLLVHDARLYGLVETDLVVDVARCEEILRRGRARNARPRPDDVIIAEHLGLS